MKEVKIEEMTDVDVKSANDRVKGFDISKLCYKTIFQALNNSGVFVKVFSELTTHNVFDKDQITLKTFNYTYVKESDGVVYPMVDLIVSVRDYNSGEDFDYCLSLTPFNAKLDNVRKCAGVYGGCDKQLSLTWRKVMKVIFREVFVEAFKDYCVRVKNLRDSEIHEEAMFKYARNDDWYIENINSI